MSFRLHNDRVVVIEAPVGYKRTYMFPGCQEVEARSAMVEVTAEARSCCEGLDEGASGAHAGLIGSGSRAWRPDNGGCAANPASTYTVRDLCCGEWAWGRARTDDAWRARLVTPCGVQSVNCSAAAGM
jgi:hypothetical protein